MTANSNFKKFCRNTSKGDSDITIREEDLKTALIKLFKKMEEKRKKIDEIVHNFTR